MGLGYTRWWAGLGPSQDDQGRVGIRFNRLFFLKLLTEKFGSGFSVFLVMKNCNQN
jgi:hypothetical protein